MNSEIINLYDTFEDEHLNISKKYLQINDSDIESTLMNHSAIYAYFASLLSYSKKVRDQKSIDLDKKEKEEFYRQMHIGKKILVLCFHF